MIIKTMRKLIESLLGVGVVLLLFTTALLQGVASPIATSRGPCLDDGMVACHYFLYTSDTPAALWRSSIDPFCSTYIIEMVDYMVLLIVQ